MKAAGRKRTIGRRTGRAPARAMRRKGVRTDIRTHVALRYALAPTRTLAMRATDPKSRLADMAAQGIDIQVISTCSLFWSTSSAPTR